MATKRWTEEMLDELASSVGELKESVTEMKESITEMKDGMTEMRESMTEMKDGMTEMKDGMTEMKDSIDGLRITSQALLQVAAQHQSKMNSFDEEIEVMKQQQAKSDQRHAENDQRFNILLEEIRYLIRGNNDEQ
ncbi:hypothetical protein [Crocosphaera sp. XPORK-15E]|uniref:hypothetical protein n=1 Tax=Crocosphaera sp. XPORK-15E TaxID=3110247 RepID=UPI002B21DB47|nr:hypothetical protein [Crocosphaera sp. XPORK-15E]MEA5536748.1 hypothetical protein [Crocosphaera sp. XPORK-15E]